MTMRAVREKLTNKLSEVSEITAGIYRGVRRKGGQDFAAYVFDLNGKLPRTVGHLSTYLDDVLGQSYFSEATAPDLRWNNYLYFVVKDDEANDPGFKATKQILEKDRSYARKYVVLERELERVLNELDSIAAVDDITQATDVLHVWSEKLGPNGLNDILDENRTISDIVREISTGSARNTTRSRKISGLLESKTLVSSRIESIDVGGFRQYPTRSTVQKLGKANLIFGPNGAGKTSFMEALEFLFCGANRRSSAPPLSCVSGRLQSGAFVTTSDIQLLSDFKTRQRLWYGSDDTSRNNNLPNQFSRFNFLNTDAAAELSLFKDISKSGQKNHSETLADLLSGHEATEVWKRIQSLQKTVVSEAREKHSACNVARIEKEAKADVLRKLEETPGQADASFSIFVKDLERIAWRELPLEAESAVTNLENTLSELGSQLSVVRQLSWMGSDITEHSISESIKAFSLAMPALQGELSEIAKNEEFARSLRGKYGIAIAKRDALAAVSPDAVNDLILSTKNLKEAKSELALNAKPFSALFVDLPPEGWQDRYGPQLVGVAQEECAAKGKGLKEELIKKEEALAELTSTHTKLQNAISQVQEWSRKVIEHRHSDQHCPVCSTEFKPGELLRRIQEHASAPVELATADLKQEIGKLNREILDVIGVTKWLSALLKFSISVPGGAALTVLEAQPMAMAMHGRLLDLFAIQERSRNRIDDYARAGLTLQQIENLCSSFEDSEHVETAVLDIEEAKQRVTVRLSELENQNSEIDRKVSIHRAEIKRLLATLAIDTEQSFPVAQEIVQARLNQLQRARAACDKLNSYLDVHSMTNLASLCGSIEGAVLSAKKVISLIEQEAKAHSEKSIIKERLGELEVKIKEYDESVGRLEKASVVIKDILDNHSLEAATTAVVEGTHMVADSIFSRIHAPAEYRINSDSQIPLARRDTDVAVQLNEVSTGQRAAYALSMFLAMNAQVKDGPKIMLLDDPISHIDDLNALSFLDYLRNIVLSSDRQLFFATADEKIAGLFVHKFGFLKDDFQVIELNRS